MWGRALVVAQAGPSTCHQAYRCRSLITIALESNQHWTASGSRGRCYATNPPPPTAQSKTSRKPPSTPSRASTPRKTAPGHPPVPLARPRPPPIPSRSLPSTIEGVRVQRLEGPPHCPEWPWKLVKTDHDGTQEFSRIIFARHHFDVPPQLPMYSGIFVFGIIIMFGTFYQTSGEIDPKAKATLHAKLGDRIASHFDDGIPIWFFPSLAGLIALLPYTILRIQGGNIIRLTQVRYQPPNGKPARTVLRMKTPNHVMKIPFTRICPYPKSRDIDPSKCTIRWSYRGTEEVELNLRTHDTRFTQDYFMYFTPTKSLQRATGEDVVLSVQRLEQVFGRPGEPGSQYHITPTFFHRVTEFMTPYKEKEENA